jgi:hypothetical protein
VEVFFMSTEDTTGLDSTSTGQDESAPETDVVTGQPLDSPEASEGEQSATSETTGTTETDSGSEEESFFNYDEIKDNPELVKAYKQMQGSFTKAMQANKEGAQKIAAFDAFQADPVGQMQAMSKQLGFTMTRAEAQAELQNQATQTADFQPETWDDVLSMIEGKIESKMVGIMEQKYGPVVSQVQSMKSQSIEKFLDDTAPDWRQYEDKMKATLNSHPTLANDPETLYRMSVPPEILESRATKKAIAKMQGKVNSSKTSGISTAKKSTSTSEVPDSGASFDDVVKWAKEQVSSGASLKH